MKKFVSLTGKAIPFGLSNVDTDMIIPARFLKTITRAGLGEGAFANLREDPDNIIDAHMGDPILIAGANFGCGSSREHAPWALLEIGIKVVIAPDFADIFAGNAVKNGLLLVALPHAAIERLLTVAREGLEISVDLEQQTVSTPYQDRFHFEIDPFRKRCLLNGLDEIGLSEKLIPEISQYEKQLASARPWVSGASHRKEAA